MSITFRTLVWRTLYAAGTEMCTLAGTDGGYQISGHVVTVLANLPASVRYGVSCDAAWRTRTVTVDQVHGATQSRLHLLVDGDRRWTLDGVELPALQGCVDVDLSVTPSTNTLPIRRLALEVGASANVTAAWVRFPGLSVEPLVQSYTHLSESVYRYASGNGQFTALVEVDELGLVVRYEGGWERVATT